MAIFNYIVNNPFNSLMILIVLVITKNIIYYLYLIIKDRRSYKKINNMLYETDYIISQLGFVIGIFGQIGAGKSTGACAITTALERQIIGNLIRRNDYIRTIINNFDFNKLNELLLILSQDDKATVERTFAIVEDTISEYIYIEQEENKEIYLFDRTYDDGIKSVTYEVLMKEYIENSLALYRNNYVFCNVKYKSNITGNKAFDLTGEDFKVKERYWKKDYRLRRHSVFFYDESTLDPDKLNLNWQEKSKNDDGTIEHLRLFRHYYKGTSFYITTLQNVGRLNKSERELFNSLIKVEGRKELSYSVTLKRIVSGLLMINDKYHRLAMRFVPKNKRRQLDNAVTGYKKRKKVLMHWMDKLKAKDPILYKVRIYNGTKQAENESRDYDSATLLFARKDCYGPGDTYEYSYCYDASIEQSFVTPEAKLDDSHIENKIVLANQSLKIMQKSAKKSKNVEKKESEEDVDITGICSN